MLAEQAGADRSAQTHALVAAALEMGLDDGQVAVLLNSHAPTVEKYGNRIDDELARQLDKQRPKHPHPGQPCDRAGCPNRPRWQTGERNLTDWIGPRATAPVAADEQEPEQVGTSPHLPVDLAGFWAERPVLEHLHSYARARMVSPWALLGVSVVRALAVVPPHVVLPPIVGTHASLNFFVGLVGRSGAGKGAAEGAGHDALDVGPVEVFTASSGEGLAHLYAHREKKEVVRDRDAVLLTVPEVDTLVALKSRQGSTLLPALRSAWSGERLGFSYADPDKALPIERHSYRLGLVLGVQPGRAAPLLDDADGGTPQRFLWMPTTDRDAPDELPAAPAQWPVKRPSWFSHAPSCGCTPRRRPRPHRHRLLPHRAQLHAGSPGPKPHAISRGAARQPEPRGVPMVNNTDRLRDRAEDHRDRLRLIDESYLSPAQKAALRRRAAESFAAVCRELAPDDGRMPSREDLLGRNDT